MGDIFKNIFPKGNDLKRITKKLICITRSTQRKTEGTYANIKGKHLRD